MLELLRLFRKFRYREHGNTDPRHVSHFSTHFLEVITQIIVNNKISHHIYWFMSAKYTVYIVWGKNYLNNFRRHDESL